MSRSLLAAGLALLLAAVAVRAGDADKPKDKDEKEKLTPAGEIYGRFASADNDKQTLTLQGPGGKPGRVLDLGPDLKVRTAKPPLAFDDKGNVKKYTEEELRDLKGTEGLPGYKADLSDLKAGDQLKIKVSRRKKTAEEIREAQKAGDPIREVATMIVIETQVK